jgi:hypothetical protein
MSLICSCVRGLLVLQVGFEMPIPIPDLRVDDEGVFGTLSFSRTPFACSVPWNAVFALVGDEGRGMVWPDSMPPEIVAEVEREAMRAKLSTEPREPAPRDAGLRADADVRRLSGAPKFERLDGDAGRGKPAKEPVVAVLRAAEPDGRRRDSSRPGPARAAGRRGKSLPPYLRIVK